MIERVRERKRQVRPSKRPSPVAASYVTPRQRNNPSKEDLYVEGSAVIACIFGPVMCKVEKQNESTLDVKVR